MQIISDLQNGRGGVDDILSSRRPPPFLSPFTAFSHCRVVFCHRYATTSPFSHRPPFPVTATPWRVLFVLSVDPVVLLRFYCNSSLKSLNPSPTIQVVKLASLLEPHPLALVLDPFALSPVAQLTVSRIRFSQSRRQWRDGHPLVQMNYTSTSHLSRLCFLWTRVSLDELCEAIPVRDPIGEGSCSCMHRECWT